MFVLEYVGGVRRRFEMPAGVLSDEATDLTRPVPDPGEKNGAVTNGGHNAMFRESIEWISGWVDYLRRRRMRASPPRPRRAVEDGSGIAATLPSTTKLSK